MRGGIDINQLHINCTNCTLTGITPPYLQAHCQSPTSQRTNQSFVKELANAAQEKLVLKNFHPFKKNKKRTAHPDTKRQIRKQTITLKPNTDNGLQGRTTEHQLPTAVLQKWRCSASYDSEVVNQNLVLRLKFSGKNPPLRKAAKRYAARLIDKTNKKLWKK